jgi:DNA-binding beta-propeller fold protein YncE
MASRVRFVLAAGALVVAGTTLQVANAHSIRANRSSALSPVDARPHAHAGHATVPAGAMHPGSHGGTVAVDEHGVLVAERNAGALVRADRQGAPIARLALHEGLGELVSDGRGTVFVADRRANRVVAVDVRQPSTMTLRAELEIAEPYGLALSPDGRTLYVTSIADQGLVTVDADNLRVVARTKLRAEPRGVAVSSDGKRAAVGFLSSGNLAIVDLDARRPKIRWRALDPRDHVAITKAEDDWGEDFIDVATVREARSRFEVPTDQGRRHARNVFAVAWVGHGQVVAPHQLSTPQMKRIPSRQMADSYGGGPEAVPAIEHRLAVVDGTDTRSRTRFSTLIAHQPRAVAYDPRRDTLYVAGYGDDKIVAVAEASAATAHAVWDAEPRRHTGRDACGPDGIAVDGDHVWVHCELSRRLVRLTPADLDLRDNSWVREKRGVVPGPELAATLRSPEVEQGAELFRRGRDWTLSDMGVMACSSCHPEGRQDGLSWRLGKAILQTPMLAGRIDETAPYKWSGEDPDLSASFRHTIARLGGNPDGLASADFSALAAYVTSLPSPVAPTPQDEAAIARGRKIFTDELGCDACHDGAKLTDGSQYALASRGLEQTDTPSLVGLAHTAPYYHDGSAVDLYALVTDKGSVHDMADFSGWQGSRSTISSPTSSRSSNLSELVSPCTATRSPPSCCSAWPRSPAHCLLARPPTPQAMDPSRARQTSIPSRTTPSTTPKPRPSASPWAAACTRPRSPRSSSIPPDRRP